MAPGRVERSPLLTLSPGEPGTASKRPPCEPVPVPGPALPCRGGRGARTRAVLLQPPDLGVQPLEGAGVLPLQEEEVLLGAVQLVLQGCGRHADIQVTCGRHRHWRLSLTTAVVGDRLEEDAAC